MFAVPQTPAVLVPPEVQSELAQHPPFMGTHRLVFGQLPNPVAQVILQVPVVALHTAEPFDVGAGQELHPAPQKLVLVSG